MTGTTSMGVQYEVNPGRMPKRKAARRTACRWPARWRKQAAKASLYALAVICSAALAALVGDLFWPEVQTAPAAQTAAPTAAVSTVPRTASPRPDADDTLVWIPASGSRYHANAECSNMREPQEAPLTQAVALGLTPCKRCNPPSQATTQQKGDDTT